MLPFAILPGLTAYNFWSNFTCQLLVALIPSSSGTLPPVTPHSSYGRRPEHTCANGIFPLLEESTPCDPLTGISSGWNTLTPPLSETEAICLPNLRAGAVTQIPSTGLLSEDCDPL